MCGFRLEALHETSFPCSACQVVSEQPPTCPHVYDGHTASDKVIRYHRGEISCSSLPTPEDLDGCLHRRLAQIPPDVSWRQVVRSPVHCIALECTVLNRQRS